MTDAKNTNASDFDYRGMLETQACIGWRALPNGQIDYVSPNGVKYLGRTAEQLAQWGWTDVIHPDDLPRVGAAWGESLESGKEYRVVYRAKNASDGKYYRHIVVASPQRDANGAIIRWSGLGVNIDDLLPPA